MKYKLYIIINLSRDRVIELYDNPENLKKWQPDLLSYEHRSGEIGKVGSTSQLIYGIGKKETEMIETLVLKKLPDKISMTYDTKNTWNRVDNKFLLLEAGKTKWECSTVFRCSGVMRIMSFLLPGVFKKRSLKYMRQFKVFAESA